MSCISIGESVEFTKALSAEDIATFAAISGDNGSGAHQRGIRPQYRSWRASHGAALANVRPRRARPSASSSMHLKAVPPVSSGYDRTRFTRPVIAGDTPTARYKIERLDDVAGRTRAKIEVRNAQGETYLVPTHILVKIAESLAKQSVARDAGAHSRIRI